MEDGARFEFGPCLGRGGFGEVYQAQMRTRGGVSRLVAVKILRDRIQDVDSAIQRLRDEAHLLAALHHRAFVQVHDLVELDGQVALVTEFLPGADLDRIVFEDKQVPPRVALEVIGEVAGALQAAWSEPAPGTTTPMRLVHRDIKPANIRVTPKGAVKLLDFGIARSPEVDREARTGTGIVLGTVGYFSPERLTEDLPQHTDDVYALGCVLYELVTGLKLYRDMKRADLFRLAFHPDNHAAFLQERLQNTPEGVRFWPALQPLLQRVLATDPTERPNAGELEETCFRLLKDLDGPSLREWSRERTWSEPRFIPGNFEGRIVSSTGSEPTVADPHFVRPTPAPPAVPQPPTARPPRAAPLPTPRPTPPPTPSGSLLPRVVLGLAIGLGAAGGAWYLQQHSSTAPDPMSEGSTSVAVAHPDERPSAAEPEAQPDAEPSPTEAASTEAASTEAASPTPAPALRMPEAPDAEPPRPLPASLDGSRLLTLRDETTLELRDLASPGKPTVTFAKAQMKATDVCLRGDTMAFVMGGTVEVRRVSDDTVIDRMRPGGRVVDRVLCLPDGQVVAVSRAPRIGSGGGTGEVVWWTNQGRVRGKLLPPAGVVTAEVAGDRVLVIDGEGAIREWTGQGSPVPETLPLRGPATGVTPSLSGPTWAVSSRSACSLDGTCVQLDGSRGLVTSGVGWVAIGGADRITVLDSVEGQIVRDIPAAPTELFAMSDGTLLVVEPTGIRQLNPITGAEQLQRGW